MLPQPPSTEVAFELNAFVKHFLPLVAQASRLALPTPLGHISKRFEEFVTSGKANSAIFSIFCPQSKGFINYKHLFQQSD